VVHLAGVEALRVARMSDKSLEEQLLYHVDWLASPNLEEIKEVANHLRALATQVGELEREPNVFRRVIVEELVARNAQYEVRIETLEAALRELTRRNVLSIYDSSEGRRMNDFIGVVLESFNAARAALNPEDTDAPPATEVDRG